MQLLYANEAAAETLGYASAEVLLSTPREQLVADADYFTEDGSPLLPEQLPDHARGPRRGSRPGDDPDRQALDRRGALARDEGARRQRQPRPHAAGGQRHRGHHGAQALGARAAAALPHRRGALVLDRLRADAAGGRRPRRARAGGLVRREHARPLRRDPPGRGRPQRPRQGRVRAQARPAATRPARATTAARRRSCATASRSSCRRSPTSCSTEAVDGPRAARAGAQPRHALGRDGADGGGERAADGRHLVRQRRVGPRVHRGRPRAVRGDRAARRHRGRERAPLQRALDDRAHAPARAAAARAAGDPGLRASPRCTARRGRRTGSAATSTTPSRSTAAGWWWSATSPAAARRRPR